eukprot:m.361407 g.361407  ORF g.361407 m.361407 type:complete len:1234 (-) comp19581_c0_seq1:528-4229(-)
MGSSLCTCMQLQPDMSRQQRRRRSLQVHREPRPQAVAVTSSSLASGLPTSQVEASTAHASLAACTCTSAGAAVSASVTTERKVSRRAITVGDDGRGDSESDSSDGEDIDGSEDGVIQFMSPACPLHHRPTCRLYPQHSLFEEGMNGLDSDLAPQHLQSQLDAPTTQLSLALLSQNQPFIAEDELSSDRLPHASHSPRTPRAQRAMLGPKDLTPTRPSAGRRWLAAFSRRGRRASRQLMTSEMDCDVAPNQPYSHASTRTPSSTRTRMSLDKAGLHVVHVYRGTGTLGFQIAANEGETQYFPVVLAVQPGSAADRAGLKTNDAIATVGTTAVYGASLTTVLDLIKQSGPVVSLCITKRQTPATKALLRRIAKQRDPNAEVHIDPLEGPPPPTKGHCDITHCTNGAPLGVSLALLRDLLRVHPFLIGETSTTSRSHPLAASSLSSAVQQAQATIAATSTQSRPSELSTPRPFDRVTPLGVGLFVRVQDLVDYNVGDNSKEDVAAVRYIDDLDSTGCAYVAPCNVAVICAQSLAAHYLINALSTQARAQLRSNCTSYVSRPYVWIELLCEAPVQPSRSSSSSSPSSQVLTAEATHRTTSQKVAMPTKAALSSPSSPMAQVVQPATQATPQSSVADSVSAPFSTLQGAGTINQTTGFAELACNPAMLRVCQHVDSVLLVATNALGLPYSARPLGFKALCDVVSAAISDTPVRLLHSCTPSYAASRFIKNILADPVKHCRSFANVSVQTRDIVEQSVVASSADAGATFNGVPLHDSDVDDADDMEDSEDDELEPLAEADGERTDLSTTARHSCNAIDSGGAFVELCEQTLYLCALRCVLSVDLQLLAQEATSPHQFIEFVLALCDAVLEACELSSTAYALVNATKQATPTQVSTQVRTELHKTKKTAGVRTAQQPKPCLTAQQQCAIEQMCQLVVTLHQCTQQERHAGSIQPEQHQTNPMLSLTPAICRAVQGKLFSLAAVNVLHDALLSVQDTPRMPTLAPAICALHAIQLAYSTKVQQASTATTQAIATPVTAPSIGSDHQEPQQQQSVHHSGMLDSAIASAVTVDGSICETWDSLAQATSLCACTRQRAGDVPSSSQCACCCAHTKALRTPTTPVGVIHQTHQRHLLTSTSAADRETNPSGATLSLGTHSWTTHGWGASGCVSATSSDAPCPTLPEALALAQRAESNCSIVEHSPHHEAQQKQHPDHETASFLSSTPRHSLSAQFARLPSPQAEV